MSAGLIEADLREPGVDVVLEFPAPMSAGLIEASVACTAVCALVTFPAPMSAGLIEANQIAPLLRLGYLISRADERGPH